MRRPTLVPRLYRPILPLVWPKLANSSVSVLFQRGSLLLPCCPRPAPPTPAHPPSAISCCSLLPLCLLKMSSAGQPGGACLASAIQRDERGRAGRGGPAVVKFRTPPAPSAFAEAGRQAGRAQRVSRARAQGWQRKSRLAARARGKAASLSDHGVVEFITHVACSRELKMEIEKARQNA